MKDLSVIHKQLGCIDLTIKFEENLKFRVPTGIIVLDRITGGGIPGGKLTEISGGPSAWKSLLILQILAEVQKMGGLAVYVDIERSLEKGLVELTDIDLEALMYPDPDDLITVEDVYTLLEKTCEISNKENIFTVFGWDSVAATPIKEDVEKPIGRNEASMRRAKLIGDGLRKHIPLVHQSNTALVFVNQLRDKIGVMFGEKEDTPGGRAIKFWSSLRLRLKYMGKIKDEQTKEQVGGKGTLVVAKSKVSPPYGIMNFEIMVGEQIGRYAGLLDYMIRHGDVVMYSAGWYGFVGDDKDDKFRKVDFPKLYEEREAKNGKI